jgi:aspartate carbamoyltransferase regulatory subunit
MGMKNGNGLDTNQLVIDRIENGVVVDHIPPGMALTVLEILGTKGADFLKKGNTVAVAINVRSLKRKEQRKDVLKIQNFLLSKNDEVRLGLVVPGATLNIIKEFIVVDKRKISLPKYIAGLKCPSSSCITNEHEDTKNTFDIVALENNVPYMRCRYCEEAFKLDEVIKSLH